MATGYSGVGYQLALASCSADGTVCDGNTATGPDHTEASGPGCSLTAIVDYGSTVTVTSIDVTFGYSNTPTIALEYSSDDSSWTAITFTAPPSNFGVFATLTQNTGAISVSCRYLRFSANDGGAPFERVSIREITPVVTAVALSGQSLTAGRGTLAPAQSVGLSPFDGLQIVLGDVLPSLVAISGQAVAIALGNLTVAPTLTGQSLLVRQGVSLGPNDAVAAASGQAAVAAAGSLVPATAAVLAGHALPVRGGAVRGPNDVVAALTGQSVTAEDGITPNAFTVQGGRKCWTIKDTTRIHKVYWTSYLAPCAYAATLTFPIPAGIIALGSGVSDDGLWYFADSLPDSNSFGLSHFGWDAFCTVDFDGRSLSSTPPPYKIFEHAGQAYPIDTYSGNTLVNTNHGPFYVSRGFYSPNWSKLMYDHQGGNMVFVAGVWGEDGLHDGSTYSILRDAYLQFCVQTGPIPEDFVRLSATTFDGCLNVAWISEGWPGKLKQQVHLGPQLQIGSSGTGWQPVQEIESTKDCYSCGLTYLPEGRLYLNYNQANTNKQRYNDQRGTGVAGDWSAKTSADADHISAGGTGQEQGWRYLAGVNSGAAGVVFDQCRDGQGSAWTTGTPAVASAGRGPLVGGAWLGNEYGLLYTRHSDGKIYYLSSGEPDSWPAGPGIDTGFVGNVCGMVKHPSGRLVGIRQMVSGGAVTAILSNDAGATWALSSGAVGVSSNPPPVIVAVGDVLYVVHISSDSPRFVASADAGDTWT